MNQPWFQRGFRRAVACGAVIAVGGALAMAQAAQTGGQSADGQVEMDVVHALDAQQTLANDLITAATVNGTVTLTGTVSSQASKDLAERVVRGVAGVSAVQDNLQVGNPENDPNAQAGQNVDEGAASEDNGPPSGAGTPGNPPQWSQQPNEAPNQAQNQAQDEGANSNDANQPPVNSPNAGQRPEYGQAPQAGNGPGNGLSAPDWGPAGPPPGYGQNQGQNQGQAPPQAGNGPGNGQNAPDWGPAGPPPGYGQSQGQQQGQAPPPGYGQAPPPPGYGQGPNAQGPYAQGPYGRQYGGEPGPEPGRPNYQYAQGPLTVPMGTLIQVRTNEPVASKRATAGTPVEFTVIQDVTLGGVLAIPRGATVHGVVEEAKQSHSGQLGGSSELALRLTSLDLGGQSYPLASDLFKVRGPSKAGRTVGSAIG
ncbi:MAG: BON domain-containing protein, partial [Terracidiphilus sp.]